MLRSLCYTWGGTYLRSKTSPKKSACGYCSQVGHLHSTVCNDRDRPALVPSVHPPIRTRGPVSVTHRPSRPHRCPLIHAGLPRSPRRSPPERCQKRCTILTAASTATRHPAGRPSVALWSSQSSKGWDSGGACPGQGAHVMQAFSISSCKATHHRAVVIPEMRSKIPRGISTIADRRRRVLSVAILCCHG
ncbi:hypothetical protein V8C26DRAFT_387969 [Trichoderma gracile]